MSYMFSKCSSLSSLPDISKWNTNNVTGIGAMFGRCPSLLSLPDISKWNTNNAIDILLIYYGYFIIVNHYYLYQIFQNGILIMLLI